MKITIAFDDTEEREAAIITAFIKGLFNGAKVSKKDRETKIKHTYITTRRKGKS